MINQYLFRHFLPAALAILSAAIFISASELPGPRGAGGLHYGLSLSQESGSKRNARPGEPAQNQAGDIPKPKAVNASYLYEFSQPQFYVRKVRIEHDSNGRGKITFERLNEDVPVVEDLELSPTALERIVSLFKSLHFLDSETNYQSDKQFPHLGTMRIGLEAEGRKRTVEFNWTNDRDAAALAEEYRRITDQSVFIFDITLARENQPLNAPKLMDGLEILLKRNGLSDPQQLVPLLQEISTDEHLPLIARNHALRLLKRIEKGK